MSNDPSGLTPEEVEDLRVRDDRRALLPVTIVEVMATDDRGRSEVLQVEEPSGQQRMFFVGIG